MADQSDDQELRSLIGEMIKADKSEGEISAFVQKYDEAHKPGMARRAWSYINTPLTETMATPTMKTALRSFGEEHPYFAKVGEFGAAQTTPLQIGLMGTAAAAPLAKAAGSIRLGKALKAPSKIASAGMIGQGGYRAVEGETLPEKTAGLFEAGLGVGGIRSPRELARVAGPKLETFGERTGPWYGRMAGAALGGAAGGKIGVPSLGHAVGGSIGFFAPEMIEKMGEILTRYGRKVPKAQLKNIDKALVDNLEAELAEREARLTTETAADTATRTAADKVDTQRAKRVLAADRAQLKLFSDQLKEKAEQDRLTAIRTDREGQEPESRFTRTTSAKDPTTGVQESRVETFKPKEPEGATPRGWPKNVPFDPSRIKPAPPVAVQPGPMRPPIQPVEGAATLTRSNMPPIQVEGEMRPVLEAAAAQRTPEGVAAMGRLRQGAPPMAPDIGGREIPTSPEMRSAPPRPLSKHPAPQTPFERMMLETQVPESLSIEGIAPEMMGAGGPPAGGPTLGLGRAESKPLSDVRLGGAKVKSGRESLLNPTLSKGSEADWFELKRTRPDLSDMEIEALMNQMRANRAQVNRYPTGAPTSMERFMPEIEPPYSTLE